jgi:siroheme synthase (precorrin-2 oxidase/ferrochelatase)
MDDLTDEERETLAAGGNVIKGCRVYKDRFDNWGKGVSVNLERGEYTMDHLHAIVAAISDSALKAVRAAALEEAAQVCDDLASPDAGAVVWPKLVAETIRALIPGKSAPPRS